MKQRNWRPPLVCQGLEFKCAADVADELSILEGCSGAQAGWNEKWPDLTPFCSASTEAAQPTNARWSAGGGTAESIG